ncbi:hypothetical protein KQH82_13055 [bacterium]|nr:hypothetical protein [bacterium]
MNTGRILICALVILALFGCGYNPDKPVYDTLENPKNFPQEALDLLDDIEAKKLMDYESVEKRFESLYESHFGLLDNEDWGDVIVKLGTKFRVWADSMAAEGIPKFYQAGGLYALASFARPDDFRVRDKKELFDTWRAAVESGPPASLFVDPSTVPTLNERIDLAKSFVLADSLHRAFAEQHLLPPLFVSEGTNWLRVQAVQQLRAADQAFLDHAGLVDFAFESPLTSFDSGKVELIDCMMTPIEGADQYRIEAYFIPRDSIEEDLGVVFRIQAPESTPYTVDYAGESWTPYDFATLTPSSTWPVGKVAPAIGTLYYSGPPAPALIGLMVLDQKNPRPLPVDSALGNFFELPPTVFPKTGARQPDGSTIPE